MARLRYLDGLEAAQRVFRALPRESQERITHALNLGAKEVVDDAKTLVPVDEGDLKDTVHATRPRTFRADRSVVVFVTAGDTRETANAAYRQEFGRAPSGEGHPGHPAQEFIFPAYWAKRRRIRSRIKREIRRAARLVARLRR